MVTFRLFTVFFFIFSITNAKSFHADSVRDHDNGPFSQEYKTKFLKNLNILNKLLAEKSNSKYTSTEITAESYEANFQNKTRQNPYLFGGDVILTDEQWNVIIEDIREQIRTQKNQENESFVPNIEKKSVTSSPVSLWKTFPIPYYINGGGHVLGLYHEQCRSDRDSYVFINYNLIPRNDLHNFEKASASMMNDYGVPYDYGSIMHYRADVYDNNNIVIMPFDPNYLETLGQTEGLSFRDIKKINLAYCSSKCSNTLICENGGYVDPNDCSKCKCPHGLGGRLCGVAAGPCGQDLTATNTIQTITAAGVFRCNYFIKAPAGKRIFFNFRKMLGFPEYGYHQCGPGVTVNFNSDLTKSGVHVCAKNLPSGVSESDQMIVIHQGWGLSRLTLEYRIN